MNVQPAGLVLIGLSIAGCATVGVEVDEFKPAQGPQGVHMELKLNGDIVDGNSIEGELLAVRADGVVLNVLNHTDKAEPSARLVWVPFRMMNKARLEQMGSVRIKSQGQAMDEKNLNKLRLVARFPQGLSDELLATLLAESGQAQIEVPQRQE